MEAIRRWRCGEGLLWKRPSAHLLRWFWCLSASVWQYIINSLWGSGQASLPASWYFSQRGQLPRPAGKWNQHLHKTCQQSKDGVLWSFLEDCCDFGLDIRQSTNTSLCTDDGAAEMQLYSLIHQDTLTDSRCVHNSSWFSCSPFYPLQQNHCKAPCVPHYAKCPDELNTAALPEPQNKMEWTVTKWRFMYLFIYGNILNMQHAPPKDTIHWWNYKY